MFNFNSESVFGASSSFFSRRVLFLVVGIVGAVGLALGGGFWLTQDSPDPESDKGVEIDVGASIGAKEGPEAEEDSEVDEDPRGRYRYQWRRLHDPSTGKIPSGIRRAELQFASNLPAKIRPKSHRWVYKGPDGNGPKTGGRTRALAVDVRDQSVLLAGGVSGGIFRSTDGGTNWTRTTAPGQLPSVTDVEQDLSNKSVWYAGTGEGRGNSASGGGAFYAGNGIYKSTDGGRTWSLLSSTTSSDVRWTDDFDVVWDVETDPSNTSNGEVYAATWSGVFRSTDGGTSWAEVRDVSGRRSRFSDVAVAPNGTVYAAVEGGGIFKSTTGQQGSSNWTDITPSNFPSGASRTEIAVSPSKPEEVWFFTNSPPGSGSGPNGHMLWRWDNGSSSMKTFSGRLPNRGGQTGTLNTQGSYDQVVAVHPDDKNIVFVGGRNLWRIDVSASASDANTWIGGYTIGNNSFGFYNPSGSATHHPDQHSIAFRPTDGDVMYVGSDGGVHFTKDSRAGSAGSAGDGAVKWSSLNDDYHTNQIYQVCAHPSKPRIGWGMQDNGSMSTSIPTPADQFKDELGADGGYCDIGPGVNTAETRYFTVQNGRVFRFDYDSNGNRVGGARVDRSNTSGELFINPFEVDPSARNVMYYPAGSNLYRNRQIEGSSPRATSNWSELTGVSNAVGSANISTLKASRSNAPNVLYIGTSDGRVFRLPNANTGAASSSPTNVTGSGFPSGAFVSEIAIHPNNSDEIIVTFSNYRVTSVFHSTDGGSSWTSIEGSLSGRNGPSVRSATILPQRGNKPTTYFLGTSVGAFSTTSLQGGSTTWKQESPQGYGNAVVDDIVARPPMQVVAGTHGKGAYVLGGRGTSLTGLNLTINTVRVGNFPRLTALVQVTDQNGDPVRGLDEANFGLKEEGQPQPVKEVVEQANQGPSNVSIGLTLDDSGSMSGSKISALRTAAKALVDKLKPDDRAAVVRFDNSISVAQPFTSDKSKLKTAIDNLNAGGGTAFYDAAIRGIKETEQEGTRDKAVVALTDGIDNASSNGPQDVIDLANQRGIPVFTIALGSGADEQVLKDIANKTGGRFFDSPSTSQLDKIFQDIRSQLANRYLVQWETPTDVLDGTTRNFMIHVTRNKAEAQTGSDYTAPGQRVQTRATFTKAPKPGQSTTAAVNVGTKSNPVTDLFSISVKLNFDAKNLNFDGASPGGFFGGSSNVNFNTIVDQKQGTVEISVRKKSSPSIGGPTSPLPSLSPTERRAATGGTDGSGTVASVDFTVDKNAPSGSSPSLGVGDVQATDSKGNPIATISTKIFGALKYPTVKGGNLTDRAPIGGATVAAFDGQGNKENTDQTRSSTGGYDLPVANGESYDVLVQSVGSAQGINILDALELQKNILGRVSFPRFQKIVGDVDGNGSINIFDALEIEKKILGRISSFPAGTFHFKRAVRNVSGTDKEANLRAAAIGDANLDGNFGSSPSASSQLAVTRVEGSGAAAKSKKAGEGTNRALKPGSVFEVPIRAGGRAELSAYQFSADYPTDKARFLGARGPVDKMKASGRGGTVRLAWFDREGGNSPISVKKGENIAVLRFEATKRLDGDDSFRLESVDGVLGTPKGESVSGVGVRVQTLRFGPPRPESFALRENAPNPFRTRTTLRMDLPRDGSVTVKLYNLLGQKVATVRKELSAGHDRGIQIDGRSLSSGRYFYRVRVDLGAKTVRETGQMTVVR